MSHQHSESAPVNKAFLAAAIVANAAAFGIVAFWFWHFIVVLWRWAVGIA